MTLFFCLFVCFHFIIVIGFVFVFIVVYVFVVLLFYVVVIDFEKNILTFWFCFFRLLFTIMTV